MTEFNENPPSLDKIENAIVRMVYKRTKPACHVRNPYLYQAAFQQGLDTVPLLIDNPGTPPHQEGYIIARKQKASDYLRNITLPLIPEIEGKTLILLHQIYDKSIAQALVDIIKYQWRDLGLERLGPPEGVLLEGLLYGYKPCDVKYYVQTRNLHYPQNPTAESMSDRLAYSDNPHVICPDCAYRMAFPES